MIETLTKEQNDNFTLFLDAINALRYSQGYYARLFNTIINLSENELYTLIVKLPKFNDQVDVILFLEQ